MLQRDHYAVLGVPPDASAEEIEKAYLRLCRRYHPELNPGSVSATAAFERVETAYRVLSDPERRARYDKDGRPTPETEIRVRGESIRVEAGKPGTELDSFQQLFSALRDHERRSRPPRGDDVHAAVRVPLGLAERGRRTMLQLRRQVPCDACSGRGRVGLEQAAPCSRCEGSGQEVFTKGALSIACRCADCGGDGLRTGERCATCDGSGLTSRPETVSVQIPCGVSEGQVVTVRGAGHYGRRGGPAGDLRVTCHVAADERFERQGPNLACRVKVSVAEAIVGGRVPVETLEGPALLRIPPGTQNGRVLRLRGRGLELPGGRRGDLLVTVEIWVPELVDEDAKNLIREFGARTPKPPRAGDRERATVEQ